MLLRAKRKVICYYTSWCLIACSTLETLIKSHSISSVQQLECATFSAVGTMFLLNMSSHFSAERHASLVTTFYTRFLFLPLALQVENNFQYQRGNKNSVPSTVIILDMHFCWERLVSFLGIAFIIVRTLSKMIFN